MADSVNQGRRSTLPAVLDPDTRQALEFDAFLGLAAELADTAGGKRTLLASEPLDDPHRALTLLRQTSEARKWAEELRPSLAGLQDASGVLDALAVEGLVLDPVQIQTAAAWIEKAAALRSGLRPHTSGFPLLWSLLGPLPDLSDWVRDVSRTLDADGQILDSASPAMRRIRRAIAATRERLNQILEKYFSSDSLQDAYVTERGGRFVVPVRTGRKDAIKGVLHGSSSSGATLFVEPLEAVEWNNGRARLLEEEAAEAHRILGELSHALSGRREEFRAVVETLHDLDAALGRGRLSARQGGVEPAIIPEGSGFRLVQARHPMLIGFLGLDRVVPMDLQLGGGIDILVVSGPNAGGKTVVLKTAGLHCAMAQCGFHLPAVSAEMSVFRSIRADIGDHQSLQSSLSTFSFHVLRMKAILEEAGTGLLVLLDELGTATDPAQGASLGIALLEALRRHGALVLATTHLERLKGFAADKSFAENLAMEFDENSLRPTFRLLRGLAGQSNALNIAQRLGLQEEVLAAAREKMPAEDADLARYMDELQQRMERADRERAALEEERKKLAGDRERWKQERAELQAQEVQTLERRLKELEEKFEEALGRELAGIRDRTEREQMRRARRDRMAQLRQEQVRRMQASTEPSAGEERLVAPALNSPITVISLGRTGVLRAIEGRQAVVEVEGKRLRVPLADLEAHRTRESPPTLPDHIRVQTARPEGATPKELNLIGQNVDDAILQVDKFLDAAFLEGYATVRLIHGRGTGRLRKGVREFLAGHPHVQQATPAPDDQGGAAVTVVQLRD